MQAENIRPVILCFGGLDPSGGAGLQADIEAIAYCGGHALPVATCLTVQNTRQAYAFTPIEVNLIQQQTEKLLQDVTIAACKIGVIPDSEIATTIAGLIAKIPDIPVVLDPVLHASKGSQFSDEDTINAIKNTLLPLASIVTPNIAELSILTAEHATLELRARELCRHGPAYVLLTNGDKTGSKVCNQLFANSGLIEEYYWPKLPRVYHGSGCTLSSALACYAAKNMEIPIAAKLAQEYTWQSLQSAEPLGRGQWIPRRIHNDSVK